MPQCVRVDRLSDPLALGTASPVPAVVHGLHQRFSCAAWHSMPVPIIGVLAKAAGWSELPRQGLLGKARSTARQEATRTAHSDGSLLSLSIHNQTFARRHLDDTADKGPTGGESLQTSPGPTCITWCLLLPHEGSGRTGEISQASESC